MADSNTPNYNFIIQEPGTNRNTWGGKLNSNWTSIDGLLFTATTNANSALTLANGALQRTGGAMSGSLLLSAAGSNDPLEAGFRGCPRTRNIDVSTTLLLSDNGGMVRRFGPNPTTLTVPTMASVPFPLGATIYLRSFAAGVWNIVREAGVEIRVPLSGTSKDFTIASLGEATITLEDINIWVIRGTGLS